MDTLVFIVAILSVLVTVLIGWNIFYALNIKKEMLDKISEKHEDCLEKLKQHSELNKKDFDNVIQTLKRSENQYNKLDGCILHILQDMKKNQNKSNK